jgi:hypothetical protein
MEKEKLPLSSLAVLTKQVNRDFRLRELKPEEDKTGKTIVDMVTLNNKKYLVEYSVISPDAVDPSVPGATIRLLNGGFLKARFEVDPKSGTILSPDVNINRIEALTQPRTVIFRPGTPQERRDVLPKGTLVYLDEGLNEIIGIVGYSFILKDVFDWVDEQGYGYMKMPNPPALGQSNYSRSEDFNWIDKVAYGLKKMPAKPNAPAHFQIISTEKGLLLSDFPHPENLNRLLFAGKPSFNQPYDKHLDDIKAVSKLTEDQLRAEYSWTFEDYNTKVARLAKQWGLSVERFEKKYKGAMFDSVTGGLLVPSKKTLKEPFYVVFQDDQGKIAKAFIQIVDTAKDEYEGVPFASEYYEHIITYNKYTKVNEPVQKAQDPSLAAATRAPPELTAKQTELAELEKQRLQPVDSQLAPLKDKLSQLQAKQIIPTLKAALTKGAPNTVKVINTPAGYINVEYDNAGNPKPFLALGGAVQYTGDLDASNFHHNFMPLVRPAGELAAQLKDNAITIYLPPDNLTS